MKQTMKKCLTLLLALALLFTMAVPAAAATPYDKTITFTDVAEGDTVKAYKLVGYNTTYTEYEFHKDFKNFVDTHYNNTGKATEQYLSSLDPSHTAALLAGYVNMCQTPGALGGHALPTESATATADASNQVALTLEPGYYVVLGSTNTTNDRTYQLTSVFVQVKNDEAKVIAGDRKTEITDGKVQLKHTTGPIISMSVKDDKGAPAAWKGAAAGQVGEVLDFYIHVQLQDYNNDNVFMTKLALENTLKGLQYVENSAGVYNTEDIAGETPTANAFTVDAVPAYADGSQTVTFNLIYKNIKGTGGVSAYLHFKAKVMPEAAAKGETATADTTLTYTFSLEPTTSRTTSPVGVKVHTYAFSLAKTSDEDIEGGTGKKPLTNAGFTLYSDAGMTTAVSMIRETNAGDTYYRPATAAEITVGTGIVTELLADMGTGQNTLLVRGLDAATYYLEETKVPAGYYAPKGGFAVQLTGDREVSKTLNGKLAAASSFTAINATDNVLLGTASVNGTEMNRLDASLKNSSTPVLPTTGGVGTVMFTVIGLLCMGAALWFFLFARRRRKDEQEQG